jgi:hypothetical protein
MRILSQSLGRRARKRYFAAVHLAEPAMAQNFCGAGAALADNFL